MRPRDVRRLFRFATRSRGDIHADIADERAHHLDLRTDELIAGGMSRDAARLRAEREFGGAPPILADTARSGERLERRRRLFRFASDLRQDLALAARLLIRAPTFAVVAIVTLGLGIGANTAIYSVLDALLLHPTPYPEPDRLVQVSETRADGGLNSPSGGAFLDWRAHETQFDAIVLTGRVAANLRHGGPPERLRGLEVSHEFLQVLGVAPLLGRGFIPDDDRPGGQNNVVLLTEELWRSRFAADPGIVGRDIVLDEVPRTVVGVLPRGAWVIKDDLYFIPAVLTPGSERAARAPHWAAVFARLAPDATVESANADLTLVRQQLAAEYPAFKQKWGVRVESVDDFVATVTRGPLTILIGAVSLVLLIACANVANLLLARGCQRQQELAIRTALGAGGARLVRQLLTENLALAALGGALGVAIAWLGVAVLERIASELLPLRIAFALNLRVLGFSLAITLATGLFFGLVPALITRRGALARTMSLGGRTVTAASRPRALSALVVAEVALTVVLVASAGLLLRSLTKVATIDPGFEPARVLAFDLSLPPASYDSDARRLAFSSALLDRLRGLPGVDAAGSGRGIPFSGGSYGESFGVAGQRDARDQIIGRLDFVSAGFLEALGSRLLAGRFIEAGDNRAGAERVAVISATTVRMLFADRDPIGQPLRITGDNWRVVGVVADIVERQLDVLPGPYAWVPQVFNSSRLSVAVRTPLDPISLASAVRSEMARVDAGVAMANPRALDRAMAGSMQQRRVVFGLVGMFAASALLLACIGLYGVMAYVVATRRRELGIRIALGAVRADVMRDVFRSGLTITAAGLALGLGGALVAGRVMASQLFQVGRADPAVAAATVAVVAVVATLACFVPARRAASVDPVTVLRSE